MCHAGCVPSPSASKGNVKMLTQYQRQETDRGPITTIRTGDATYVVASHPSSFQESGVLGPAFSALEAAFTAWLAGLARLAPTHTPKGIAGEAAAPGRLRPVQTALAGTARAVRTAQAQGEEWVARSFDTRPQPGPFEALVWQSTLNCYAAMPDDRARFEAAMRAELPELHALREGGPILPPDLWQHVVNRHRKLNYIARISAEVGPPKPTLQDPAPVGFDKIEANARADRALADIKIIAERIELARQVLSRTVVAIAAVLGKPAETVLSELLGDG